MSLHAVHAWDEQRGSCLACERCAVNTYSNYSGATACSACNTLLTGAYQSETGQTACQACMSNVSSTADTCTAGTSFVQDFERMRALFDIYQSDHEADIEHYLPEICKGGYACLPCEPGIMSASAPACPAPSAHISPTSAHKSATCAQRVRIHKSSRPREPKKTGMSESRPRQFPKFRESEKGQRT